VGNKAKLYSQKSVWDFKTPTKSYGQISERVFENVQKMSLPTRL